MADEDLQTTASLMQSIAANQQTINKLLSDASRLRQTEIGDLSKEVNYLKSIGDFETASIVHAKNMATQRRQANELFEKFIKSEQKSASLNKEQIDNMRKLAEGERKRLSLVSEYSEVLDKIGKQHDRQIEQLRAEGRWIQANGKEFLKQKFSLTAEEGLGRAGAGTKGAKIAGGVSSIASDPGQMLQMLGPWGVLIQILIGMADRIRKLGAEMHTASGATGEFAKGVAHFQDVAIGASVQMNSAKDTFFGQMGMTTEEVIQSASSLATVGIKIADTLGDGGSMSESFRNMVTFASATGQELTTVGKQFATFTNTFRMGKNQQAATYKALYDTARDFTKSFDVTMGEMIGSIMTVAEASQSLGVTLEDTSKLFHTLKNATAGTKISLQDIAKAATQLTNIGKADTGWLAFMGKMGGGASGGFLGGLGAAQQRGANFMGPTANGRNLDLGAQIDMMQKALSRSTRGLGGANRQFITEQLGKNFGMDEQTVQIMQKMQAGGLSRAGAVDQLKKLQKQAEDNKISNKGLLDILKNFLEKMIATPILLIYKLMKNSWLFSNSKPDLAQASAGGSSIPTRIPKRDFGAEAVTAGLVMVHPQEKIVPAAATTRALNMDSGAGPAQPLNINISVTTDERELKMAFDQAHNKTLQVIRRQKQRMIG